MSWGERSCIHSGNCPIPDECSITKCNINCRRYEWDKETKQDQFFKIEKDEQLSKKGKK